MDSRRHPGDVELVVPSDASFLRLARYAAADAATRAGLDVDAVDDVRLAISELCSLLVGEHADRAVIRLRFSIEGGNVTAEGSGRPGPALVGENGELALVLVRAVVDEFEFEAEESSARFRVVKRGV